jgi:hypothetical protein
MHTSISISVETLSAELTSWLNKKLVGNTEKRDI